MEAVENKSKSESCNLSQFVRFFFGIDGEDNKVRERKKNEMIILFILF